MEEAALPNEVDARSILLEGNAFVVEGTHKNVVIEGTTSTSTLRVDSEILVVPRIANIVSSLNVGCTLDLKFIAMKALNTEYNPKRFNAVIMRIKEPKTTALIFPSGKLIVTGAKGEDDSKLACRKFVRVLQKLGYPVKLIDLKVQNMVGSAELPFGINLIMLSAMHHKHGKWEPEIFPGMLYKMVDPKVTLLIFSSGKVVILGAKTKLDLQRAFYQIYPILDEFKRDASS